MSNINKIEESKQLRALVAVRLGAKFPLRHVLESKEIEAQPGVVDEAERELEVCQTHGITLRIRGERGYPVLLAHIHNPPPILYVKGNLPDLSENFVAAGIVGSRKADITGCRSAAKMARTLTRFGVCVISGLALGIDGAAHEGALAGDTVPPTVAVLGNGLASVYPRRHASLARRILEREGALLSMFPPNEPPYPYNFLNRNRIIAGLSRGVIIFQAAKRSGALSTARHALEQGREVMVVPGDTENPRFAGSLGLLRSGATLVRDAQDVLDELGVETNTEVADSQEGLSHTALLSLLRAEGGLSFEQIERHFRNSSELMQLLFELEAEQQVVRLPGNKFGVGSL